MAGVWSEVSSAKKENRCELVLSGASVAERIADSGLDKTIFSLTKLNFLEISKANLEIVPDSIAALKSLSRLSLHSNQLVSLPEAVGKLINLKLIDVSRNKLECIPESFGNLNQLQTVNVSSNQIKEWPVDMSKFPNLVVFDVSQNLLEELPDTLFDSNLTHLSEIKARGNYITSLSPQVSVLQSLKTLDLEDNKIKTIPGEVAEAPHLKEIQIKGNPLSDRRLVKMVNQCHFKQILEYIKNNCPRDVTSAANEGGKKKKKGKGKKISESSTLEDMIEVLKLDDATPMVVVAENIKDVRPFIVCCIFKDVNLEDDIKFKRFISLQTKLHENECKNRTQATIATHDLAKISGNLTYDAKPPHEIKIVPLKLTKQVSSLELYCNLKREAEALRKDKKRNTFSGIHKYLHLLENKALFPCIVDNLNQVISFPPITNSDITKITPATKDIFVEITSGASLGICKEVMESLIKETLQLDIGSNSNILNKGHVLQVQQVKVTSSEGQLKVLYPSHPDLNFENIEIIRAM